MWTITSFLALLNLSFEILQYKSNSPSFNCLLSNWSGPQSLGSWNVKSSLWKSGLWPTHVGTIVSSLEGPAGPTEFHGAESPAEAFASPLQWPKMGHVTVLLSAHVTSQVFLWGPHSILGSEIKISWKLLYSLPCVKYRKWGGPRFPSRTRAEIYLSLFHTPRLSVLVSFVFSPAEEDWNQALPLSLVCLWDLEWDSEWLRSQKNMLVDTLRWHDPLFCFLMLSKLRRM